jgi:hypothetical protein
MSTDNMRGTPEPVVVVRAAKASALAPALTALVLPLAAFALAWMIAGKIPLAVPTREWGTWFFIGPLLGIAGIAGLVFAGKAFIRRGQRTLTVAAFILNVVAILIAWAGLFG